MHVAVIGSGISGLACAYRLSQAGHEVSLFEANDYFGGHTHTVDVEMEGQRFGVDTGFLVFNHRTYPLLVSLLQELEVETVATDMSFSVKLPVPNRTLEWSGNNLDSVFAQRRNLVNPPFLRMLSDILRFNRQATAIARAPGEHEGSLGAFLIRHGYSDAFRDWYLLPMAGCIWSCPTTQMLAFPVASFVRFCDNHGLLQVNDRPQWYTVKGGARHYVEKMLPAIRHRHLRTAVQAIHRPAPGTHEPIQLDTTQGRFSADHVVLACHSDQALGMLAADDTERAVLSAIRYQPNRAVLHTDASCLPSLEKTWSAWNYESAASTGAQTAPAQVCVHYLLNRLQPLPCKQPVIVSLNPISEPAADKVLGSFNYAHPIFDAGAIGAQRQLPELQGRRNTWFAGAWSGYGFHEDGLRSGLAVAQSLLRQVDIRPMRAIA